MAVPTSLGLVGQATGSGTTLTIPVTGPVPQSTQFVIYEVVMFFLALRQGPIGGVTSPTAADNAVAKPPNLCYPANVWNLRGETPTSYGAGLTPSGVAEAENHGLFIAQINRPLLVGKHITITFSASCYYIGAQAVGLRRANDSTGLGGLRAHTQHASNATGPCFNMPLTVDPVFSTFGVFWISEYWTSGTSSLTWLEPNVHREGAIYDVGAEAHASITLGTKPLTPGGTYEGGPCTDVWVPSPAIPFPNVVVNYGAQLQALGTNLTGLTPCAGELRCSTCSHGACSHAGGSHAHALHCP